MIGWCKQNKKVIGDKEPSQAFLWLASDLLSDGGACGMLVSAGVLFKQSTTTQQFRDSWITDIKITDVFNFTHVRKFFFNGAVSPFVLVCFKKERQGETNTNYWSAKQILSIRETQAVLFSKYDIQIIRNENLSSPQYYGKACGFGSKFRFPIFKDHSDKTKN